LFRALLFVSGGVNLRAPGWNSIRLEAGWADGDIVTVVFSVGFSPRRVRVIGAVSVDLGVVLTFVLVGLWGGVAATKRCSDRQ